MPAIVRLSSPQSGQSFPSFCPSNHLSSNYHMLGTAPDAGDSCGLGGLDLCPLRPLPLTQPAALPSPVPLPCRHSSLPWGRRPTPWPPCSSCSSS